MHLLPPPRVERSLPAVQTRREARTESRTTRRRRKAGGSLKTPCQVGAELRKAVLQLRSLLGLIETLTEKIFTGGANPERPAEWHRQIEARALQEMIRAHAVERVEMPALIRHRDERALVAREQRECAHRCAGTVIVESRSLRYALTRLGGRLLLLRGRLGEAEGQRVDCAQYAQASPG